METPSRKRITILAVVAVVAVAAVAFLTGFAATESETEMHTTVITSQAGDLPIPDDELVLIRVGESRLSEAVADGVEDALAEEGYDVTVEESPEDKYESPILVLEVTDQEVETGIFRHRAEVTAISYYSTLGNVTEYEQYRRTRSTVFHEPGTVVSGEYRLRDTTQGFVTARGYRERLTDTLGSEIVSRFRG